MSSTNGMKESYRVAHKVGDPRATRGAKTSEWCRVVVTTKLKDGKGLNGWHKVAVTI